MPANPKYLSKSKWESISKLLAGFIGGFAVVVSLHTLLGTLFDRSYIITTSYVSGLLIWSALLIVAFLPKRSWKIWLLYVAITILFFFLSQLFQ